MNMNEAIRSAVDPSPSAVPGELSADLDGRFRAQFGDDAVRSKPRTDDERSWAETFAEIEGLSAGPPEPGSVARPLPGAARASVYAPDPPADFGDLIRAHVRAGSRGGTIEQNLERIESERPYR